MSKVELTPAFLDRLRGLAQNCQPPIWELNEHNDVVSVAHTVAECGFDEDAQFIAEADPATVLAMVEEIEFLRRDNMVKAELLGKFMLKTKKKRARAVSDPSVPNFGFQLLEFDRKLP